MGTGDGTVIGTTTILNNGDPSERFNIVLVAEGYQNAELSQFHADAQQFVNHLIVTPPFDTCKAAINVYRVDVASNDSGADDPAACGGSGNAPATYFDATYCSFGGIRRALTVNNSTVRSVVDAHVPQWHQILVIVNSAIWGGTGGTIAVTSVSPRWEDIALHELGHAAFDLADEYEYYQGCGVDTNRNHYTGGEPAADNVTANTDRGTIKWGALVDSATPLPTTSNADCARCDPQPSPVPDGTAGAFEGAGYYHCGLYRPEYNCMMRNLSGFCAVCQKRIRDTLRPYMPLIDELNRFESFFDFRVMSEWILERWILVAYLIVNWSVSELRAVSGIEPDKQFFRVVAGYLGAYLKEGTMPPEDIAPAILNLADDHMAGRRMNLRAGDYIAIQNHIRRIKRLR